MKTKKHYWTKEEIKDLVNIWDTQSLEQIADKMDLPKITISIMGSKLRKNGLKLSRKRQNGYMDLLIKEVISEMKHGRK